MPLYTSEISVDNQPLAVSQSGVWTVSLTAGSIEIGTVDQGTPASIANSWPIKITDGTNVLGVTANPLADNLTQVGGSAISLGQTTMSASLPVTIASDQTALPVTLTSTTITGTVAVTQSTSPWVVSGTVTANIGTTNGLALDASVTGLQVSQGSTTSGQKGGLSLGAVTTAAPTYTTATTNALSLTTAGALRIDGSATTQPVSGTVTANAGTGNFTVVQTTGTNLHAVIDSGTITANIGTTNGLALDATLAKLTLAQGSTTSTQTGPLIQGAVTTASPSYTTAQTSPLSLNTSGSLRTDNTSWLGSTAPTVGSKTSANSIPVVIASDQGAIPVSGTITTTPTTVSTATVTSNSVGAGAAVTLLASRAARIKAVIFNETGILFVKAGSTASSTDYTWRMTANTELDVDSYTGILTAIKSSGTSNVQATDF